MSDHYDLLLEIKETLKYAIKHKDWSDVCEIVEQINEELDIEEKVEYVSARDRDEELNEEDES
jgi:hypothetical protein